MPRKINTTPTHELVFRREGEKVYQQAAFGKTDLLDMVRQLLSDGYTNVTIQKLKTKK